MYAVIETGGKQYSVEPGMIVQIEKIEGEIGNSFTFDKILFVSKPSSDEAASSQVWIGAPYLVGATVEGTFVGQGRDKKVTIVKMKRRKQYRRVQGHRQYQTQLLVTKVTNGAGEILALSQTDVDAKLKTISTQLKPKGLAKTAKTPVRQRASALKAVAAKAKKV